MTPEQELIEIIKKIDTSETEKQSMIQLISDFGLTESLKATIAAWLDKISQEKDAAFEEQVKQIESEMKGVVDQAIEESELLQDRLKALTQETQRTTDDKQIDAIRKQIGI